MTGVAFGVTSVALLLFWYISTLGLGYFLEGYVEPVDLAGIMPSFLHGSDKILVLYAVVSLIFLVLSAFFFVILCRSKATKNGRKGLPSEIVSGSVIVILLAFGSLPFMKFLSVYSHEFEIEAEAISMIDSAKSIDGNYLDYVEERTEELISRSSQEIDNSLIAAASLKRRLIPTNYEEVKSKRKDWLNEMTTISIWNPCTAHNIKTIMDASKSWTEQYREFASFFYTGESETQFTHEGSVINRELWTDIFRSIDVPNILTLLFVAFVISLILVLYFSIERQPNTYGGTHNNL